MITIVRPPAPIPQQEGADPGSDNKPADRHYKFTLPEIWSLASVLVGLAITIGMVVYYYNTLNNQIEDLNKFKEKNEDLLTNLRSQINQQSSVVKSIVDSLHPQSSPKKAPKHEDQ